MNESLVNTESGEHKWLMTSILKCYDFILVIWRFPQNMLLIYSHNFISKMNICFMNYVCIILAVLLINKCYLFVCFNSLFTIILKFLLI